VRDVHDHAVRISDVIDTLREMLGTALSVNLSLVTLAQGETVIEGAEAAEVSYPAFWQDLERLVAGEQVREATRRGSGT